MVAESAGVVVTQNEPSRVKQSLAKRCTSWTNIPAVASRSFTSDLVKVREDTHRKPLESSFADGSKLSPASGESTVSDTRGRGGVANDSAGLGVPSQASAKLHGQVCHDATSAGVIGGSCPINQRQDFWNPRFTCTLLALFRKCPEISGVGEGNRTLVCVA